MRILCTGVLIVLFPALAGAIDLPRSDTQKTFESDARSLAVIGKNSNGRKRIALVIGNSSYISSPLKNPANDAIAIAATLKRLGFDVDMRTNIGRVQMEEAVEMFGNRLATGGVGLFYYAGHGIQVAGNNYLVPVDAKINSEGEVRYKAIDAGLVLAKMDQAKSDVNIVIMDACRDNPFGRSFRSAARGLATMDAPGGTIIAYSTSPGKTAADGDGENGLYTSELLKVIESTNISLEGVFKRVRKSVMDRTSGQQTPWESSSLIGEFSFKPNQIATAEILKSAPHISGGLDDLLANSETEELAKKQHLEILMADLATYERILSSSDGGESKKNAWNVLVAKYPIAKNVATFDVKTFLTLQNLFIDNGSIITREEMERRQAGEFVEVPAGCFSFGFKEVCLEKYKIGKYDVTQGQYKRVMGVNPSYFKQCGNDCPVESVRWNDVQKFISRLNDLTGKHFRLPTEAEWEYACRSGGKNETFCGGDNIETVAWYNSNSNNTTHPVGQRQPNELGLYDMSGNVWQWVQIRNDENNESGVSGSNTPTTASDHVTRGGSWSDEPRLLRASNHYDYVTGENKKNLGFRLVYPSTQ